MWQLLVHSDEDVRDLLGEAVRTALDRRGVKLSKESNLAAAEASLADGNADECNLVIIGARTPVTKTASVGNSPRAPVVEFIKRLKGERPDLALIVLATTADETLGVFLDMFRATALVDFSAEWRDILQSRVAELMNGAARTSSAYLELDITLAGPRRTSWRIHRKGRDVFEDSGELYVEESELKRLIRKSTELEDRVQRGGWQSELSDIGSDLNRLLFESSWTNRKLWTKFVDHRARVGGVENTRVRVTLNDDTHPVLIEALKDEDDPSYWMLKAPISRRYDLPGARYPLFKDHPSREGPINVLVIDADPSAGNVPDDEWARDFAPLPEIDREASDLVTIFETARDRGGRGGVVDRLSVARIDDDPVAAVFAKLSERHWHVVHFAGHGVWSAARKEAGLVLVPERGGVLRVEDLANKLIGTQFLFLNSCRSADSYFVMHAVRQYVPAVLGFRWSVSDKGGADFARAFYAALFDGTRASYKYLEYAFMHARRIIHDRDSSDPTWASPVLVMQLSQIQDG